MRKPLITGVSGYFGSRLVQQLDKDSDVVGIVGIDIVEPAYSSRKLKFYKLDVNDFSLRDLVREEEIDSVFHFSFIVNPIHDSEKMFKTNVNGTRHLLDICHRLNIRKILVTSSASAYGAHADNPELLKETDPLRGNEDFQYSRDKMIIDELCQDYMKSHRDTLFILVRPCIVLGEHVDNYISRLIKRKIVFTVSGYDPYFQFVQEDDLSSILYIMMKREKRGIYNIAGDGKIRLSEIIKLANIKEIKLPYRVARFICSLFWRFHLYETPPSFIPFIMYSWLVDTTKLKSTLGEDIFRYDSRSTVIEFLKKSQR